MELGWRHWTYSHSLLVHYGDFVDVLLHVQTYVIAGRSDILATFYVCGRNVGKR